MAGMLGIASAIFKHLILKPILPPIDQVNTYFSSDTREAGTLTLILVTTRLRSPFSSLYFIPSFKFADPSQLHAIRRHGPWGALQTWKPRSLPHSSCNSRLQSAISQDISCSRFTPINTRKWFDWLRCICSNNPWDFLAVDGCPDWWRTTPLETTPYWGLPPWFRLIIIIADIVLFFHLSFISLWQRERANYAFLSFVSILLC